MNQNRLKSVTHGKTYQCACFLVLLSVLVGIGQLNAQDNAKQTIDDSGKGNSKEKIPVLIIDGQNNHAHWPKTTAMMKRYLEETNLFEVDVARTRFVWNGAELLKEFPLSSDQEFVEVKNPKTDPDFAPDFSKYKVVVNNLGYGAAPLPGKTEEAFVAYMKNGGGLVSVHAADNCWPEWKEYNLMIGLGGWGGRSEKHGPYVFLNDKGEVIRDNAKGPGGGHGPQHDFPMIVREPKHPIVAGLPSEFMHGKDELYERLRGPAENMTVLATAFASPKFDGSGRHEPALMTIEYHKGRVFHSILGHADYSMESVAFITTFIRGTEWAATGEVTFKKPNDFPGSDQIKKRTFESTAKSKLP